MAQTDLEPQDWDDFRRVAHELLETCLDRLQAASEHPWQPVPDDIAARYAIADAAPVGIQGLVDRLRADVIPYATGNTHPRFFGWVHGSGLPVGVLSEMAAATMNSNCGGRDHGAIYMERAVIDWARGVFGFPAQASGVLVTGTSQATVVALAAARVRALGPKLRKAGQGGVQLTAYAGGGVHNATTKALELMGLGADSLRLIPDDAAGRMDIAALNDAIAADRAAGAQPFALVGTAGTVDLGQVDDLNALADVAADQGLWLHVDGAFGAWLRLAGAPWADLVAGIDRADSLGCDFHKWMYVPYDCGLVLLRDEAEQRAAFAARPSYLEGQDRGLAGGDPWFCDYGVDLSRGNRALKVWSALQAHGPDTLGAAIAGNCEQAHEMGRLVTTEPNMALLAPVVSNLCVFTADAGQPPAAQSDLNRRIAQDLQLAGHTVFSTVDIGGVTGLRAAITNHRTTLADIHAAITAVGATRDRIDL